MSIECKIVCLYREVFMLNKIMGIFLSILVIGEYEACYGCARHMEYTSARSSLSSTLHSVTLDTLNVPEAVRIADKCIEACNAELSKRGREAIREGIPQICGQANFLKNFLMALQEVKDLTGGKQLSESSKKIIKTADQLYRGEVGHLCNKANARLEQLGQEIAEIGQ